MGETLVGRTSVACMRAVYRCALQQTNAEEPLFRQHELPGPAFQRDHGIARGLALPDECGGPYYSPGSSSNAEMTLISCISLHSVTSLACRRSMRPRSLSDASHRSLTDRLPAPSVELRCIAILERFHGFSSPELVAREPQVGGTVPTEARAISVIPFENLYKMTRKGGS